MSVGLCLRGNQLHEVIYPSRILETLGSSARNSRMIRPYKYFCVWVLVWKVILIYIDENLTPSPLDEFPEVAGKGKIALYR